MSDPSLLRFRAVVAGALVHLESRREEINDLNVFPVADGDTGDNMVLTLRACLEEVDRLVAEEGPLDAIRRDQIVQSVARAALLGARGNSGVILSQLIRGAAEELISRPGELVDPVLIGAAMARAAQRAYGSVRAPAEGTMLTVMREMAVHVASELAHMKDARLGPDATDEQQNRVIAEVLEHAIEAGEASVARGPELLPVLREAGVVDAGGHAVTIVLAGVVAALRGEDAPQIAHHARRGSRIPSTSPRPTATARTSPSPASRCSPALRPRARAARRLGARGRRRGDAEGPRPHRRPRAGDRRLRRGRRGVAPRRGRHARAGRRARCAPGGQRNGTAPAESASGALAVVAGAGMARCSRASAATCSTAAPR